MPPSALSCIQETYLKREEKAQYAVFVLGYGNKE